MTTDILIFQPSTPLAVQTLFTDAGGALCTGAEKLCQRWLLEFLTELGSMTHSKKRGCPFMTTARSGKLQTELDVFQAFAVSLPYLEENLQGEEADTDDADERYSGAQLLRVSVVPGRINLRVRIRSRSGESSGVSIPVKLSP